MIVLTIVLVVLALAVLTVGFLGFTQKLPGNGVIGLRIPEVRKSAENWNLAHKIAGPAWMGSGVALLGAALMTLRISGWMWLVFALLIVGALFLIGMGSAMAASTMAKLEHLRSQQEEDERAAEGCCSSGSSQDAAPAGAGEPSAAECASGNACGSCSLNGACEGGGAAFDAEHGAGAGGAGVGAGAAGGASGAGQAAQPEPAKPALDLDAARRAVAEQDRR